MKTQQFISVINASFRTNKRINRDFTFSAAIVQWQRSSECTKARTMQDFPTPPKKKSKPRTGRSFYIIRLAGWTADGRPEVTVDLTAYSNHQAAQRALRAEFGTSNWPVTVAITETTSPERHAERFAGLKFADKDDGLAGVRRMGTDFVKLVRAMPGGRPFVLAHMAPLITIRTVNDLTGWPELPPQSTTKPGDLELLRLRHLRMLLSHQQFPRMKIARRSQTDDFPLYYAAHRSVTRYRSRFPDPYGQVLDLNDFLAVEATDGIGVGYKGHIGAFYSNALAPEGYDAMKAQPDGTVILAKRHGEHHVLLHMLYDPKARTSGAPAWGRAPSEFRA